MITTQGEVLINVVGPTDGVRLVSDNYVLSAEDSATILEAIRAANLDWCRHVALTRPWIDTLKRDLGVEIDRAVRQAIANNAHPVHDLHSPRYDVCTDWIVDRAVAKLRQVETFNDGGGI